MQWRQPAIHATQQVPRPTPLPTSSIHALRPTATITAAAAAARAAAAAAAAAVCVPRMACRTPAHHGPHPSSTCWYCCCCCCQAVHCTRGWAPTIWTSTVGAWGGRWATVAPRAPICHQAVEQLQAISQLDVFPVEPRILCNRLLPFLGQVLWWSGWWCREGQHTGNMRQGFWKLYQQSGLSCLACCGTAIISPQDDTAKLKPGLLATCHHRHTHRTGPGPP
jgi:hypothetical protein